MLSDCAFLCAFRGQNNPKNRLAVDRVKPTSGTTLFSLSTWSIFWAG